MNESVQLAGEVVSHLNAQQSLVLILLLPFLLVGFILFLTLRRRLGLVDEPAGRDAQDLLDRTKLIITTLQSELGRSQAVTQAYTTELEMLRSARLFLYLRARQCSDAALAARVMVHELERQFGVHETVFPPLPDVPESAGAPKP